MFVFIIWLRKLSNRKSNETWELVQSGDDGVGGWDYFELETLLKWVDSPPPKINLGLF